jgi:hypothetical protein
MPAVDKERQAEGFAQMWNIIITSFRKEDFINDRYLIDFPQVHWTMQRHVDYQHLKAYQRVYVSCCYLITVELVLVAKAATTKKPLISNKLG